MNKTFFHRYITAGCMALAAMLTLSSCNSLFDEAPEDKLTDESIWTTENLLDEYTMAWYSNMNSGWKSMMSTSSFFGMKYMSYITPAFYADQSTYGMANWVNSGVGEEIASKESTVILYGSNRWKAYYLQIQSINRLLENADKMPTTYKQRILGEAHFFRGYYYYLLMQRFGGVLLIDHTYDPLHSDERFPRASYTQMAEFIAHEADLAAEALPVKHDNRNLGRVTKGAALMLKAKTYFWVGSPQFQNKEKEYYGFTDDQSRAYMLKAIEAYKAVDALNQYKLMPVSGSKQADIAQSYHDLFLQHNNAESILEYQHGESKLTSEGAHSLDQIAMPPVLTGTQCAYCPTQNHVEEYGMRDGKAFDPQNPYANRDYRFYANVLYDGTVFRDSVMELHYIIDKKGKEVAQSGLTKYGTGRSNGFSRTGYYMRKFLDPKTTYPYKDNEGSKQNYPIWRYAELLLDYAEAAFRTGDTKTALEKVNQVRQRVHMHPLSDITLEQIQNERRVEMAFEETTYWDKLRLGTAVKDLNGSTNPLRLMKIVYRTDGTKTYTVEELKNQKAERAFRDYQYYGAIPWNEVRFQGIDQNAGWVEK